MNAPAASSVIPVPINRLPFSGTPEAFYVNIQISPGQNTAPVHPCLVDTGSVGIVIPEQLLYDGQNNLLPGVTKGPPIVIPYQPSKNDLQGYVYYVENLAVGATNAGGSAYVCQNVAVAGVSTSNADEGMMGIGFGRPNPFGTNVFLTGTGTYPSYLLTSEGIWLGYTAGTLPAGYQFQPLVPQGSDWQTPAVTITVENTAYPGTALLDTGINSMMFGLGFPGWEQSFTGQQVSLSWGSGGNPPLSYGFTVGPTEQVQIGANDVTVYTVQGPSVMLPEYIVPIGSANLAANTSAPFVNTGIHVLKGANYFFDSSVGQIGFYQPNS